MTEHDQPDPLPPDLAALFAKERAGYGEYAATQDVAYERIVERLALVAQPASDGGGSGGVPKASAPAAATNAAVSVKVAALVAATALTVGVLAGRATVPVASTPPQPVGASASATPAPALPPPPSAALQMPLAPTSSASAARVLPSAATSAAVPQGTLAQERELVEGARAALTRGRPGDALAATDRHAQLFPRGRLAEEREVLAITALASLGRVPEAEARRTRFLRAYPDSLLSPPAFSSGDGGSR